MNANNFDVLVQNLQANKMKLFQNKEELANIVKSLDIPVPIESNAKKTTIKKDPIPFINNKNNFHNSFLKDNRKI